MTPSRSGHLPINGLSLYYEVYGELGTSTAAPLLVIPGGFMATDSMTAWVSAFVSKRAVIVFDQQGHGRTPDTSREMSYEQFADDAAVLLRAQVSSISAKTMVIIGDADAVKPEHALAMFKLRGGGDEEAAAAGMLQKVPAARLVILPAMSHVGLAAESAVLAPMMTVFLDDVPPATPDLF